MRPRGIIYRIGKSGTHGEVLLILPLFVKIAYHLLKTFGSALLAFGILTFMFSFGPILDQELNYRLSEVSDDFQAEENSLAPNVVEADKIVQVQKEALENGVSSYFSVVIPKINAASNIIANVDAADKKGYLEALQKGVAHAKGTNFPGQKGTIFLFSHSTDSPLNFAKYNAVFYLLNKLEKEDKIIVFFSDKKYEYEVIDKFIAEPSDTSWLTSTSGEEKLVLMTCDPPGTTWRRLLVSAGPVSNN